MTSGKPTLEFVVIVAYQMEGKRKQQALVTPQRIRLKVYNTQSMGFRD